MDEDASGFPMKEMQKLHWRQYEKDNLWAKLVRGRILGLLEGQLPTRAQINASDIFTLCPPQPQEDKEEKAKVDVIDVHSSKSKRHSEIVLPRNLSLPQIGPNSTLLRV